VDSMESVISSLLERIRMTNAARAPVMGWAAVRALNRMISKTASGVEEL